MRPIVLALITLGACRCGETHSPAAAPAQQAAAPATSETAVVTDARGAVELQRRGGEWTRASRGDRIGQDDGLRTPRDAEAELSVDGVRIRLHDRSELRVASVGKGSVRATVKGRVESDVEPGKAAVSLQVVGGSTRATSEGGHFFITDDGQGAIAVAATEGSVQVESGGRSVAVRKGEVTHVASGVPVQPVEALRKVLLAVEWPSARTNQPTLAVAGRVSSGSRVYVQGEPVDVAPGGEFRADVKLHEGRQKIAVVTVDPLGRRLERNTEISRDSSPPSVRMTPPPWR